MATVTVGNIVYSDDLDFTEINPTSPSIDDYGLDTLTRMYTGPNHKLDDFLATYLAPDGTPLLVADATYQAMYAVGRPSVTIGNAFSKVTVEYKGKISGAEPLPKISIATREVTVQVLGLVTETATDVTFPIFLDYQAAATTYEYYSATRPDNPRYPNGATVSSVNVLTVSTDADAVVTCETAHGFGAGDYIIFAGVTGMDIDINNINIVKSVTSTTVFTIETDLAVAGSGGTVTLYYDVSEDAYNPNCIVVTRKRGWVYAEDEWHEAQSYYADFDQNMTRFDREQIGNWWRCREEWEWNLLQNVEPTTA